MPGYRNDGKKYYVTGLQKPSAIQLFEFCSVPISCSFTTTFFQQWIALVTTPQGWKMPEKSKIMFENAGPPEERFQYSFCEVRE